MQNRSGAERAPQQSQLEYMAEMIRELQTMAHSRRLKTLAQILELAHSEATLRSRDH